MTHTDLQGLLAGADVSLPWAYRPCEYDDWGFIRGPEKISDLIGPYRPVVCLSRQSDVTEEQMAEHRVAKTDPYEPVGRLVVAAVNALPQLLASLTAKYAEREIMVAALLDIAKTSRDEGGCFYNNRISISRARDTLKEIGIDWLNPEGALHQNPESKA